MWGAQKRVCTVYPDVGARPRLVVHTLDIDEFAQGVRRGWDIRLQELQGRSGCAERKLEPQHEIGSYSHLLRRSRIHCALSFPLHITSSNFLDGSLLCHC
jgi:hypothetical protein